MDHSSTPLSALQPLSRPRRHGRVIVWGGFALVLLLAPLVWRSSFAQTMLSQVGIGIIVCLAYNVLLVQGGMLSFGHAVYSGLGAYLAIEQAFCLATREKPPYRTDPVPVFPLHAA